MQEKPLDRADSGIGSGGGGHGGGWCEVACSPAVLDWSPRRGEACGARGGRRNRVKTKGNVMGHRVLGCGVEVLGPMATESDLFSAVDALLQGEEPLPPPAERVRLREAAGITQARTAQV